MTDRVASDTAVELPEVGLDRDVFMRTLLRELSGTLQDVVGLDEASGFISVVGQSMGRQMNAAYRAGLGNRLLDRGEVAAVLVDLKRRIEGGFSIEEESDERIVLSNTQCPFAEKVEGRPALCMMTSNVFGVIAAENLGYARVELNETIAAGHAGCRVTVHLREPAEHERVRGREYFAGIAEPG